MGHFYSYPSVLFYLLGFPYDLIIACEATQKNVGIYITPNHNERRYTQQAKHMVESWFRILSKILLLHQIEWYTEKGGTRK